LFKKEDELIFGILIGNCEEMGNFALKLKLTTTTCGLN